jgi:hypothetical protein
MAVKTLFWIPSCRTQKDAALRYRTTKEQEVHEIEKVIYFFNLSVHASHGKCVDNVCLCCA